MNLQPNTKTEKEYINVQQSVRVITERWFVENMFCPNCGAERIVKTPNNSKVADAFCASCKEVFELKSKKGKSFAIISDGEYFTAISRLTSNTNPDLFVLNYTKDFFVSDLTVVPKFFFVPSLIVKRKTLGPNAQRAGWTGCNILLRNVPEQGRIQIIKSGEIIDKEKVIKKYNASKKLKTNDLDSRGWLFDVLTCVNSIKSDTFTLKDMYNFSKSLQIKHPENHNIEPKIRQQLQYLRDKGYIEFLSQGNYRKVK